MCLGKIWDPDSRSYGDTRPFDGAQPPTIPEEFRKYVQDAIQASHELLKQNIGAVNAVDELPLMSPDICLVNFYNSSGRLGLHQVQKNHYLQLYKKSVSKHCHVGIKLVMVLNLFLNKKGKKESKTDSCLTSSLNTPFGCAYALF